MKEKQYMQLFTVLLILFLEIAVNVMPATSAPLAEREVLPLPSGLVLLHSEKTTLPIIKITLALNAGQIVEPADKAGLSHLTAGLLKEGTKNRTSKEISEEIEFVGGSLGTSGGGGFSTITLSILKKDLELGFELLSDILLNPTFPEEEFVRKKNLIKGYIQRQKEDPGDIASKAFDKELFGSHPFAWPSEGTEETLDNITRKDVVEFYHRFYVPGNAWMAVVGDVGKGEIKALISKYLKDWTGSEVHMPTVTPPSEPVKPKLIVIEKQITQANIILGHLGIKRKAPDYYATLVMNYILGGGGFASRLMDNIRDNKGLAYSVYSSFIPSKNIGSFQVNLQTKNESAATAINEIIKEMERIRTEPVSDQELADAKAYITGSFPLRMDSNSKIAGLLVSVEYYDLGMNYVQDYLKAVESVTKEDVLKSAKDHLHPDKYILVVVTNEEKAKIKQTIPITE